MVPVPSTLVDGDSPHDRPGDPLAGLDRWLADGRVDDAADDRARHRWLEQQAREEAGIAGILLDLAEQGVPTTVRTRAGTTRRGLVAALGLDHVVVRPERTGDVYIPLTSVDTVRAGESGAAHSWGDRSTGHLDGRLADALAELAADRPLVLVATGVDEVRGALVGAGRDMVTIVGATGREPVYIALAAVDHVVVLAR
jgi:hypothetical protein